MHPHCSYSISSCETFHLYRQYSYQDFDGLNDMGGEIVCSKSPFHIFMTRV